MCSIPAVAICGSPRVVGLVGQLSWNVRNAMVTAVASDDGTVTKAPFTDLTRYWYEVDSRNPLSTNDVAFAGAVPTCTHEDPLYRSMTYPVSPVTSFHFSAIECTRDALVPSCWTPSGGRTGG